MTSTGKDLDAGRIAWVDTAKALAVSLVVLYHVSGWFFAFVFVREPSSFAEFWLIVSRVLVPVRMPLFFLVAGVLAYDALRRRWGVFARTRLIDLLWPFALWSVLIGSLWGIRLRATEGESPVLALFWALSGGSQLWFLPALALFLVVGKLTVRYPVATIVAAAALALVAQPFLVPALMGSLPEPIATNLGRWATYLVWFVIGCHARAAVRRVAALPVWVALVAGVVFVALTVLPTPVILGARVTALVSIAGLIALVIGCRWASSWRPEARLARYLSGRTLAIYVGHSFLLEVLALVLLAWRAAVPELDLGYTALMAAFSPVLTCLLVWASAAMYDAANRARIGWLYAPPAAWRSPRLTTSG